MNVDECETKAQRRKMVHLFYVEQTFCQFRAVPRGTMFIRLVRSLRVPTRLGGNDFITLLFLT